MVKVSLGRPCHVPPCLINEEGGSMSLQYQRSTLNSFFLGNWATLLTYESVKAQQSLATKEKSSFFSPQLWAESALTP